MGSNGCFIVAGGDSRQIFMTKFLKYKYDILLTGFDKYDSNNKNISLDEIPDEFANGIILPLPVSYDNINLNTPFSENTIMLSELIPKIKYGGFVLGGKFSNTAKEIFDTKNLSVEDYFLREEFNIMNALATTEACIQIIMENTEFMIFGMKILITGYGRIGKLLANRLCSMGADVTVAVRKKSDMALADISGCKYCDISCEETFSSDYDVILNTVPAMIFDSKVIDILEKNVIIIDLASKPGGVDFEYAVSRKIRVIQALGLPGKNVPLSAGKIIADTVENIIRERSGWE